MKSEIERILNLIEINSDNNNMLRGDISDLTKVLYTCMTAIELIVYKMPEDEQVRFKELVALKVKNKFKGNLTD